ncbi:hypothetical protein BC835DRAFT_1303750 [Cytidiella melzeri]|nr:hypothetical protein BC835DRAFT_1303750 [Cytidiella melzeri]
MARSVFQAAACKGLLDPCMAQSCDSLFLRQPLHRRAKILYSQHYAAVVVEQKTPAGEMQASDAWNSERNNRPRAEYHGIVGLAAPHYFPSGMTVNVNRVCQDTYWQPNVAVWSCRTQREGDEARCVLGGVLFARYEDTPCEGSLGQSVRHDDPDLCENCGPCFTTCRCEDKRSRRDTESLDVTHGAAQCLSSDVEDRGFESEGGEDASIDYDDPDGTEHELSAEFGVL